MEATPKWDLHGVPYHTMSVPDDVDRQIRTLLRDGFIQQSSSPQTSPIVCVLKKTKDTELWKTNDCNNHEMKKKPEVRIVVIIAT